MIFLLPALIIIGERDTSKRRTEALSALVRLGPADRPLDRPPARHHRHLGGVHHRGRAAFPAVAIQRQHPGPPRQGKPGRRHAVESDRQVRTVLRFHDVRRAGKVARRRDGADVCGHSRPRAARRRQDHRLVPVDLDVSSSARPAAGRDQRASSGEKQRVQRRPGSTGPSSRRWSRTGSGPRRTGTTCSCSIRRSRRRSRCRCRTSATPTSSSWPHGS